MIPIIQFPKPGVGWVLHASYMVCLRGCLVPFLVKSGVVSGYWCSLLFLNTIVVSVLLDSNWCVIMNVSAFLMILGRRRFWEKVAAMGRLFIGFPRWH